MKADVPYLKSLVDEIFEKNTYMQSIYPGDIPQCVRGVLPVRSGRRVF